MGGSRTYATIDTIYSRQCGIFINPCGNSNRPILCGKTEPLFPQITIEEESPCADTASLAFVKATELYKAYQDSLKNAFEAAYLAKCMLAFKTESFTVMHPQSIYHYTLYYYDQAGNLVKTVPPAGVDINGMLRTTWLDSVAIARKNNTVLVPSHALATNYRYNSLNQVTEQKTPDAGISTFYYDRLGRLIISQNAKQKAVSATENNRNYSYTKYDALGRITEVGQLKNATTNPVTQAITQDTTAFKTWYTAATATGANIEMVTRTYYDTKYAVAIGSPALYAANLRNRVAYTTYTNGNSITNYNSATFYSYDIHGNVDTLLQDYGSSLITATANIMNSNANRWKRMVYRYDLISGKVNHVAYQPNYTDANGKLVRSQDAVYHRYSYDAENRLTIAETSTDSTVWQRDAAYTYYKHGPLARMVLGQRQVQGVDYAYTLQGWLKGVNSTTLSTTFDMGADGTNWKAVARDAYSFNLNYYNGDYTNISTTNTFAGIGVLPAGDLRNLYNGNITSMAVNIAKFNSTSGQAGDTALLYNYKYDQLNRLKSMDAFRGLNTTANTWTNSLTKLTTYRERISYDANGNILTYRRNGNLTGTPVMDSLNYTYNAATNQLNRVEDLATSSSAYADDIDNNQAANNYTYDAIGNLITDSSENIRATAGGIKWNVYGKIAEINKVDSSAAAPYNKGRIKKITYGYDATGNRISKKVERYSNALVDYTWYVRDASGNTMSTYSYTSTDATDLNANNLTQGDVYLFGSSRLGSFTVNRNVEITRQAADTTYGVYAGDSITKQPFIVGLKQYELSNHLGNVLVTISDKRIPVSAGGTTIDYYAADVITANDYYPFGMAMNGRKYQATTNSSYCYGFNGQLRSVELNSESYSAEFWQYDSRIGRRWNIDPVMKHEQSPYLCFSGNPIWRVDPRGDTDSTITAPGGKTQKIYVEKNGGGVKNIQTFSGGSYKLAGSNTMVQPDASSVKSFELDGHKFDAYFNSESGEFLGYNTVTKDGKLQTYNEFFKEWNEGGSVGAGDIIKSMVSLFKYSQYWGSPIKGFDIYEAGTLKKKTPLPIPGTSITTTIAGGQAGWNTSEGFYLQPITFNNSYINYSLPSNTASFRYSPVPGNPIGKGDFISQGRVLINLPNSSKFFENQIDLSYRLHSNTIGAGNRLKLEVPVPGGRTVEGVLGYRYELGWPRAFKNIWNF